MSLPLFNIEIRIAAEGDPLVKGGSDQRVTGQRATFGFGLARGGVSGYDIPSIRDI
jgi:hypothetical protein